MTKLKLLFLLGLFSCSAIGGVTKEGYFRPNGRGYGEPFPSVSRGLTAAPTATGYGIQYHGGRVMPGPHKIYYLYYGNWAGNAAPVILSDLANGLNQSPYFSIVSGYSTSASIISNVVGYGGSVYDPGSKGTVLSDAAILQSLQNAINGGKLPLDENGIYFVITSKEISASSGFCSSYCAFHAASNIGLTRLRYAFIGNPDRCPNLCSPQAISPNNNSAADSIANNVAHELIETITDPDFTAWYDSKGLEVSDKCSWNFGLTQLAPNGSKWNAKLGSRLFLLQTNWINIPGPNKTGHCGLN